MELQKRMRGDYDEWDGQWQAVLAATFREEPLNPRLRTVVSAGGKDASDGALTLTAEEAKALTEITDEVTYSEIADGSYRLVGKLYDITGGTLKEPAVASGEMDVNPDSSGEGTWQMKIQVSGLEAGKTYVVFEELILDGETVVGHTNPDDKQQQITVKEEEEPTPSDDPTPTPSDDPTPKPSDDPTPTPSDKPTSTPTTPSGKTATPKPSTPVEKVPAPNTNTK